MKKLKFLLILLLVLSCVISFAACDFFSNLFGGGKKLLKLTSTLFANSHIDLTNIEGFGIAENENKNHMVSLNEDGSLKDVIFLRQNGEQIEQKQIQGQIEKLYITDKFTFIMFVRSNPYYSQEESFHMSGYTCNANNQSFVIDNYTGKIYSLEEVCVSNSNLYIEIHSDYVELKNTKYYVLEVVNGALNFIDIIPNPAVELRTVFVDNHDNIFIGIMGPSEISGKLFYFDSPYWGVNYYKGSDGFAYKADYYYNETSKAEEFEVKRLDADFNESDVGTTANVAMDGAQKFIIKKDTLYKFSYSSFNYYRYNNGVFVEDKNSSSLSLPGAFLFEGEVFYLGYNNELYHYDLENKKSTLILQGISKTKTEGKRLYAIAESVTGTKKYQISFSNGTPSATLVSDITYDRNVITIQPLN